MGDGCEVLSSRSSPVSSSRHLRHFQTLTAGRLAHRHDRRVAEPRFLPLCRRPEPCPTRATWARADARDMRERARRARRVKGRCRARSAAGAVMAAVSLAATSLAGAGLVAPAPAAGQGLEFVKVWTRTLPDAGRPVALSSPNVATLEGVPAVVVGDRAGYVYAFSLAEWPDGAGLAGEHGGSPGRLDTVGGARWPAGTAATRSLWDRRTRRLLTRAVTKPSTRTGAGAGTWRSSNPASDRSRRGYLRRDRAPWP